MSPAATWQRWPHALPGKVLPLGQAVRLMCQALEATRYAHGMGFIHRDVKPNNLLVAQDGEQGDGQVG